MVMEFDGQIGSAQRRGLAWTAAYEPDTRMPKHCDGRSRISLVLAGCLEESAGRHEARASALGVALKTAEAFHSTRFGPAGARVASIDLEALAEDDPAGFRIEKLPHWRWMQGRQLPSEIRSTIAAVIDYRRFPRAPETADALREAALLLTDGIRRGSTPEARSASHWLKAVRERIDDAPDEPVSVAALARCAGVSPTHLTRRFRAAYGLSVTAYRTHRRIQQAAQRLAGPGSSLADVATDCGFHDQSHFTHHFRRLTGTTPGAWRRELLAA